MATPGTILDTIVAQKRIEVERLPAGRVTADTLRAAVQHHGPRRDFVAALRAAPPDGVALIAEIKKASPSAGVLCPEFDPVRLAREDEAAGAHCLSVLTDESFFQGSLSYLKQIRQAVRLPLLRKDFIIDERQILEAVEWGADAILLIVSILDDQQLRDFQALAMAAGLAALVEVHDEAELDRARDAGARLLGVNSRDLKTFQVDLATTERLAQRLAVTWRSAAPLLVAESGIHRRADVLRVRAAGARAILVGEALTRGASIAQKVGELLGETKT